MTITATTDQPAAAPERFQFRIRDLLLVMLLIGLALAAAVQQSIWLAGLFLVAGVACLVYWRQWSLATGVTFLFFMGTLCTLFGPAFVGKGPNHRGYCRDNLKQFVLALHVYHDVYGSFPPAYIADKNGRPMHSWRVLILPYIEQKPLYDQYRFDEPWDGPNNSKLAGTIVKAYRCPAQQAKKGSAASLETNYVAILGDHTAWQGEKALDFPDFTDGMSNVILVVEVHNSGIHWMEPRDLHVSQMATVINPIHGQGISSAHPGGAQVGMADGAVRFLKDDTPRDVLRSHIQIDDGTIPLPE
jgi:prepilin-type processing-associated H-X9-DG protein